MKKSKNYFGRLNNWIKANINRATATTSKTSIAILSAVIFILVVSISVSKSVRFFCWEHPGILLVVIAVAGEVICDWNRKKTLKERLKKFFGTILVVGLMLEISEAVKSDEQVSLANLEARKAGSEASLANLHVASLSNETVHLSIKLEASKFNNLVLQTNVLSLEKQLSEARKIATNAMSLASANDLNINLNKTKSASLDADWFMLEHGSWTNAHIDVKSLSIGPLPPGSYRLTIIYHVKNFPVLATNADIRCKIVACGIHANDLHWAEVQDITKTISYNGYVDSVAQPAPIPGFAPTESIAEEAVHTQILKVRLTGKDTILTAAIGRLTPCNADVCLFKSGTEMEITPIEEVKSGD